MPSATRPAQPTAWHRAAHGVNSSAGSTAKWKTVHSDSLRHDAMNFVGRGREFSVTRSLFQSVHILLQRIDLFDERFVPCSQPCVQLLDAIIYTAYTQTRWLSAAAGSCPARIESGRRGLSK